ncbi:MULTISPECIES: hypothetical protein [Kytococcus]|uniref:Uncharacterized protein n=1 Tax=Kytococcus schroeteri TaxID=138300 RepID=A0A2I1PCX7_9MICO|nr:MULTISPECIES: hypothetical protein [Kytococcus]OFS10470.1 hypothetical protein HMPREF3099_08600 [Kytococcus sp. HMSC28H12]PKZ42493.1 hypothetical protein CYJ76_02780 [Kytococcus schroeteri]
MRRLSAAHHPLSLAVLALLVALSFAVEAPRDWPPADWGRLPLTVRDYSVWAAVLGAVWGAVTGLRHGPGSVAPGRSTGRSIPSLLAGEVGSLVVALWAGGVIGLVPLTITLARGAPGSLGFGDALATVAGIALLALWPILGMALGTLLGRWGVLLAPLVTLALLFLPAQVRGTPLASITPWWGNGFPAPGWEMAWPATLSRLAVLALVAGALLLLAAWRLATPRGARQLPASALAAGAGAVALAAVSVGLRPDIVTASGEAVCLERQHVTLCSAPEEQQLVAAASGSIDAMVGATGAGPMTLATEAAASHQPTDLPLRGLGQRDRSSAVGTVTRGVASQLAGSSSCGPGVAQGNMEASTDLAEEIRRRAASPGPAEKGTGASALSVEEFRAWYAEHRSEIKSCRLGPEALR